MKFIITLLLICLSIFSFSQTNESKILFKLDKPMNAFSPTGTNTIYSKGARGPSAASLTPRIELCDTKDGFTIRTDFHIRKYDDNFNLVWETDLKKNYTLQANPHPLTFGDNKNSFFIETSHGENASVNKIDDKGKLTNVEIKDYKGFPLMINHDLFFLGDEPDKKTNKINYSFTYLDASSNSFKTGKVTIPPNEPEFSLGGFLNAKEDRAVLVKVYFKDIEKSKKKELIIRTMEIDKDGNITDYKKWNFSAEFINDDRKFISPTLAFDEVNNELLIFGYLSIDRKNLNGIYLIKYNYTNQNLLFSKEYSFDKIFMDAKSKKTHSSIPISVGNVVPLNFTDYDFYINKKDRILSLQIITNYHGSTTTYYEVKFDKYGDHVQTGLVEYETFNFNYHNGLKSLPKFHELLMRDNSRPHFTNARSLANDYMNNNINSSKDEIYALPIDRLTYSIIVFYNEDSGEFRGLKLK